MKNPDWKKKFHEPHVTAAQKIKKLEEQVLRLVEERDHAIQNYQYVKRDREEYRLDAARYNVLRQKELMVFDGEPKYMVREALDEYCDERKDDFFGMSLPEMINQMGNYKSGFTARPTHLMVPPALQQQAEQLLKGYKHGYDTGSQSQEADQKDSGNDKLVFRNANRYRLW